MNRVLPLLPFGFLDFPKQPKMQSVGIDKMQKLIHPKVKVPSSHKNFSPHLEPHQTGLELKTQRLFIHKHSQRTTRGNLASWSIYSWRTENWNGFSPRTQTTLETKQKQTLPSSQKTWRKTKTLFTNRKTSKQLLNQIGAIFPPEAEKKTHTHNPPTTFKSVKIFACRTAAKPCFEISFLPKFWKSLMKMKY